MGEKAAGQRASFSSRIGYVMAAAGSAVGLGNIWRFPYLAAKYGGGAFLVVYLILVFTFGYTLLMAETQLGRHTRKSPIGAFEYYGKSAPYRFGGWMNALVPMIILPYYCVIGGWVLEYLAGYCKNQVQEMAGDSFFGDFIGNASAEEMWFIIFGVCTMAVIVLGVQKGVERVSTILMPILIVLTILVAIYSITRPGALEGVKYFLIPSSENFSWMTVVSALGQMFYSLSCAMGIMITYGSYMKSDVDSEKTTTQIEFFDTFIAIMAGLMIIPAVFAFSGTDAAENLQAGPSLMFITMPKVFGSMGFGMPIGIIFFLLVFLAALTSSISIAEAVVSTFEDQLGWKRIPSALLTSAILFGFGTLCSMGFNLLSDVTILGMDFLDFFDFLSNSIMMPIAAMATCILVLRKITLDEFARQVMLTSEFKRRKIFNFVMKYLSIGFLTIILISSVLNVLGVIHI